MLIKGMKDMKANKGTVILSILATICFFVAYFVKKDSMFFILGCAWICITIEECLRINKKK